MASTLATPVAQAISLLFDGNLGRLLNYGLRPGYGLLGVWSPLTLFTNGEQGVWYDPSDFSTMFQDAEGTIPVTAVEQPVGRILDKSGRGNHAQQTTVAKRPVLQQDANGKYYLKFDGIDDALYTSSIDFTATDKMTVVAGVRKLSDATYGAVAELSSNSNVLNGSFGLFSPGSAINLQRTGFQSRGTLLNSSVFATVGNNSTNVFTGISDIPSPVVLLRKDGAQVAISTAHQGTGNFGNYPLFIGSRAGTDFLFNGHLYSLIIRGAQSSEAQILSAETYCNQKTGAY